MRRITPLLACCVTVELAFGCATDSPSSAVSAGAGAPKAERVLPAVSTEVLAKVDADFVHVPAGTLPSRYLRHVKQPDVKVEAFWLARHEVTQKDWAVVMGKNPSEEQDDPMLPVTNVSWHDARGYIERLNQAKGEPAYRMPTAQEWELACRAGALGHVAIQAKELTLSQYAWWGKSSGDRSHPVGRLKPNAYGLYDMLGNVAEWCETAEDPNAKDILRVHAGGHFADENLVGQDCSTTSWLDENAREKWTGLRLAKTSGTPIPGKTTTRH